MVTPINNQKVVTRFAPSPTGLLHIGAARTALFNFIFARQHHGVMILRIEDTDQKRSKKEFENDILEELAWLGIEYEGPYNQSRRRDLYKKYITKMIQEDTAYFSEEKEGKSRHVIRFRNPGKRVTFSDEIRGEITVDTHELGDFIIARDEETPLYHLALVIDDYEMGVTHTIRGEDHISNTPRQILLQEALGLPRSVYAHIPLILAPDRSKLSKRDNQATSINKYRKEGYLSSAVINFIALLGWSPQGIRSDPGEERSGSLLPKVSAGPGNEGSKLKDKEIFTLAELAELFSLDRIQKGGAIFDRDKLNWINRQHIKSLSIEVLKKKIKDYLPREIKALPQYGEERLTNSAFLIAERIDKFKDLQIMYERGELAYLFDIPRYDARDLLWRDESGSAKTKKNIDNVIIMLQKISSDYFNARNIKEAIWGYASREGRGAVLWPMRYALSGQDKSPDPFTLASVFGKEETIERLKQASQSLAQVTNS